MKVLPAVWCTVHESSNSPEDSGDGSNGCRYGLKRMICVSRTGYLVHNGALNQKVLKCLLFLKYQYPKWFALIAPGDVDSPLSIGQSQSSCILSKVIILYPKSSVLDVSCHTENLMLAWKAFTCDYASCHLGKLGPITMKTQGTYFGPLVPV